MPNRFPIRTDLAVEARETTLSGSEAESISGVVYQQQEEDGGRIHISRVLVKNEKGAKALGKPKGNYLTVEAQDMWKNEGGIHREVSEALAHQIRALLKEAGLKKSSSVLVVGLGNPEVTSDSLGPQVLGNLRITRTLYADGKISGIVPGVMAQTGMEAAEIVKGIVGETKPEAVIVIDALAARSVKRLGTTIQLTDTGIHPGSGVGNRRSRLDAETMGIPVIAIGAPTVVGAAAIVYDAVESLMEEVDEAERYQMVKDLVEPKLGPMIVTPKDIDDRVRRLSFVISEGLNIALLHDAYTGA
ncbi:GPR endopeptidase [Cuneatibacter sp. NSJ-177]|uniref:GPR endopeptidase n=1 Tax=Cuneatibacter sp. NSJ-177 TaxID=2931401 RepID=UPI001FCF9105|nr:GPR endopeptidase [Cuneatibacter sp. NSJ-177]MCJ7835663.1 GPR endopeptidase [Cuneatibacter sp. NSJ-177]